MHFTHSFKIDVDCKKCHTIVAGETFFFFLLFFCDIFFLQGRGNKCTKQSFYAIKADLKKTFLLLSLRNFVLCSFRFYMFYVNCCLSFSIPLPSAYSGANSVRGKCAILLPLMYEKNKKHSVSLFLKIFTTSRFCKFWLDFEGFFCL